jgi:hypothetical protein
MASDYVPEPERQFASDAASLFRERVAELVRKLPHKARGMFDGLPLERSNTLHDQSERS